MHLLDDVVRLTEYNRHYAAWVLRNFGKKRLVREPDGALVKLVVGRRNKRRPTVRPRRYDEAVKRLVVYLWECFDQMCGKPLASIVPQRLPLLLKHRKVKKRDAANEKLRLLINFFYPSVKLLEKKRVSGRIRKRYDKPKTPACRLLECRAVSATAKCLLRQQTQTLDPLVLKRQISGIQTHLLALVRRKNKWKLDTRRGAGLALNRRA